MKRLLDLCKNVTAYEFLVIEFKPTLKKIHTNPGIKKKHLALFLFMFKNVQINELHHRGCLYCVESLGLQKPIDSVVCLSACSSDKKNE